MNIENLKTFKEVARSKTIGKVAFRLNISQPVLSRRIQVLEQSLNTKLFNRTSKGVSLTSTGRFLLPYVEEILEKFDQIYEKIKIAEQKAESHLELYATDDYAHAWIYQHISRFLKKYPNVKVSIKQIDPAEPLPISADAFIGSLYPKKESSFIKYAVTSLNINLFASHEYMNQYGQAKSVEDLKRHRILMSPSILNFITPNDSILSTHFSSLPPYMEVESYYYLKNLIKEGAGLGLLPQEMINTCHYQLVSLLFNQPYGTYNLSFYYLPEKRPHKILKQLRSFLVQPMIKKLK